jgi:hypothetical protein
MARAAGVEPKAFRKALRAAKLPWHQPNARWTVPKNSRQEAEMAQVLSEMRGRA